MRHGRGPHTLALLAVYVGATALASGCSACRDVEEHGPVVKGPVRAEFIVRKEAWMKFSRSARRVDGLIVIEGPRHVEYLADCDGPARELAGDASGKRFAYRCAPTEDWRVLHLSPKGDVYAMCRTHPPAAAAVDWGALPAFDDAAPELAACAGETTDALLDELRERDAALLAKTLVATANDGLEPDRGTGDDAWQRALAKLPEGDRAGVVDALVKGVTVPTAGGAHVWRALVLARERLDRAAVLDRLDAIAKLPRRTILDDFALAGGLRWAMTGDLSRAGEIACRALGTSSHEDDYRGGISANHLALVVAKAGAACPALTAQLGCGSAPLCDDAKGAHVVCSRAELEPRVDASLGGDPLVAVRENPSAGTAEAAVLLLHRTGGLTEDFVRVNERLEYTQVPSGPYCFQIETRGAPCRCIPDGASISPILCRAKASDTEVVDGHCVMTFDDAARQIHGRHRCDPTSCERDLDCCEGACVNHRCQASSAASASASPSASAR